METITRMADAYMGLVLGLGIDGGSTGTMCVESERRTRCEEGYGMAWPVVVLHRGNAWWVSCAPGLLGIVMDGLKTGDEPEAGFSDGLINSMYGGLRENGICVTGHADTLCYVPSGTIMLSPIDGTVRPITPADDVSVFGYGVPEESVGKGTAFGAFMDGRIVGYAEATPLPTVTEATGTMLVGIATLEGHRGLGIARANLSALTNHVLSMGRLPWYHCNSSNTASKRTAESCGYRRYGELLRFHA